MNFRKKIIEELEYCANINGLNKENFKDVDIKPTPVGISGDYGIHCQFLAKKWRKNPVDIAKILATQLKPKRGGLIEKYQNVGPYLNLHLNYQKLSSYMKRMIFNLDEKDNLADIGKRKKVIIDFSSPNIAKRMSVGHLRSTIIGDALARIYSYLGYQVIKDNHLGDWGTQFGYLLSSLDRWGDEEKIAANPIEELEKLYVKANYLADWQSDFYQNLSSSEAKKKAQTIIDQARNYFLRLEQGDKQIKRKWKKIVQWSMTEFEKIYQILGVRFDLIRGESFYQPFLNQVIEKIKKSGLGIVSEGALVVDLRDVGLGVVPIQKSDGATLYITRDIATAIHRFEVEKSDILIYVVGEEQTLYFKQLFEILKRLGYKKAKNCYHISFGLVRLPEGKLSTRKGRVILLKDLLNKAFSRAEELVEEKTRVFQQKKKEELIRKIAIGSVKWNDLKKEPQQTVVFDWQSMISMEGNSCPYIQYTYARAYSLLKDKMISHFKNYQIKVPDEIEKKIILFILEFSDVIVSSAENFNPSKIAEYLFELSKAFNSFYQKLPILKEKDNEKRNSRLLLTFCFSWVIKKGLYLLGIEIANEM